MMVDTAEDLKSENEDLKRRIAKVEAENIKAIAVVQDASSQLEDQMKRAVELEKQAQAPLVKSLCKDSLGFFGESDLDKLSVETLEALRANFEGEVGRVCMDWLENRKQKDEARKQAQGTVGTYNQDTKQFDEGVVV